MVTLILVWEMHYIISIYLFMNLIWQEVTDTLGEWVHCNAGTPEHKVRGN